MESMMGCFIYRFKRCFLSVFIAALLLNFSAIASTEDLAAQGLSQNIADYSSSNYQKSDQSKRKLVYSQQGSNTKILTLIEHNNQREMQQGLNVFQPLFESVVKKSDYKSLKNIFVEQDDIKEKDDLMSELKQLDMKAEQLKSTLKNETDTKKKTSINSKLAKLSQQQRSLTKTINNFTRKQKRLMSLPVYDLAQVFSQAYKKVFFLTDKKSFYLVNSSTKRGSYQDSLSGKKLSVKNIEYRISRKIDLSAPEDIKPVNARLLSLVFYQDTLLSFQYNKQTAVLSYLQDSNLTAFGKLLKNMPLEPERLSFKGEPLTTQYLWSHGGQQKVLTVTYKETGKRKNLIQVKASAQTNVFDPKQTSTALEKHIGVLAVAKGQRLVELKKVQTINGKKDIGWDQDIRNGIIKLGQETIFVSKEDYYGYEGLWYLASWMSINTINMKKIFLINGTEPISLTAKLIRVGEVEISKAGNALYQFSIDQNGFVTSLYFTPSKQRLNLIAKETKTTKSNKIKIKQYMQTNKIVLL